MGSANGIYNRRKCSICFAFNPQNPVVQMFRIFEQYCCFYILILISLLFPSLSKVCMILVREKSVCVDQKCDNVTTTRCTMFTTWTVNVVDPLLLLSPTLGA